MEQIRLIKEMRNADKQSGRTNEHIRPRYMVWENVPEPSPVTPAKISASSSKKPQKSQKQTYLFRPPKKWANAGCIMATDGLSLGEYLTRILGVPQRRRRIALVADFGGQSAPEILFEREGVSGDIAESGAEGQGAAADAERGAGEQSGGTKTDARVFSRR
jgi:DNA (cytosine-5)-methyltransferase 1